MVNVKIVLFVFEEIKWMSFNVIVIVVSNLLDVMV